MKKAIQFFIALIAIFIVATSFQFYSAKKTSDFINENVKFAAKQYGLQTEIIEKSGEVLNPKSIIDGKMKYIRPQEWTSGFFPGSMWYLYELTGDDKWKNLGIKYTEAIEEVKNLTNHHDVGFMIGCSFGNALRLTENERYKDVIVQAAKSLSTRFRPNAGIIQSWNVTGGWQAERGWECPVIIDNMMNLELLFDATKYSGDSTFYNIAIAHADKTIEHHFRDDYTTWHVIDYSLKDGSVRHKHTAQGFSHESTWARGQSWGIYGYVVCYRETGDAKYLDQAKKAFEVVAKHINMPEDKIPYWDFDAPNIPNALRDASSAAIMASALYEMATYENREYYKGWADDIMESLASPAYRAEVGENGNFLLKHSVGSIPHGSEIDVPLNYADYYFLEALKRKRDLEK
ncbi:glycoside hydrolase family 88 protein [Mariniphaga sp.]|uniref:glycoside hydrolase family 88 protein n=1 Tax=Mariniphaga sp. TaxID=1954475 RepID=UPI003569FB6F